MPDAIGPMATVRRYADAFNKGDVKAMAALFDASRVRRELPRRSAFVAADKVDVKRERLAILQLARFFERSNSALENRGRHCHRWRDLAEHYPHLHARRFGKDGCDRQAEVVALLTAISATRLPHPV
jgi:hypothetical protein